MRSGDELPYPVWLVPGPRDVSAEYSEGAKLEAHLPTARLQIDGRREIGQWLTHRWERDVSVRSFDVTQSSGGMKVRAELDNAGTVVRERHLVHMIRDQIVNHIIYPEKVPVQMGPESVHSETSLLEGWDLDTVVRTQLAPGFSGAPLEALELPNGRRLVAKHITPRWSWVMRATHDDGREAMLWRDPSRRPAMAVDAAVVDAVQISDRWILYMDDVSDFVSVAQDEGRLVNELAGLYDIAPDHISASVCTLEDRLALFSPATATRETNGTDLGPKIIGRGWELVRDLIPSELFEFALDLVIDPKPMAGALRRLRCLLIHGDLRPGNVGITNGRPVLIDWGLATEAPPALDLVWFAFNTRALGTIDDGLDAVRSAIASRFEQSSIDLAVLATFIQACPYFGFNAIQEPDPQMRSEAAAELRRWVVHVRDALERSGHLLGRG
jgi:Phosphotransferase enzyme family